MLDILKWPLDNDWNNNNKIPLHSQSCSAHDRSLSLSSFAFLPCLRLKQKFYRIEFNSIEVYRRREMRKMENFEQ